MEVVVAVVAVVAVVVVVDVVVVAVVFVDAPTKELELPMSFLKNTKVDEERTQMLHCCDWWVSPTPNCNSLRMVVLEID